MNIFDEMKNEMERMQTAVERTGLFMTIASSLQNGVDLPLALYITSEVTATIMALNDKAGAERHRKHSEDIVKKLAEMSDARIPQSDFVEQFTYFLVSDIFTSAVDIEELEQTNELIVNLLKTGYVENKQLKSITKTIYESMKSDLELISNIEANC